MKQRKVPYLVTVFGKGYGALIAGLVAIAFPWGSFLYAGEIDFTNVLGTIVFWMFQTFGLFLVIINLMYIKNYKK